jgi:hypothetical protein
MNHYTIKIHNEKEDLWDERVVERLTFPEAAMEAYTARSKLGYAWKVVSIYKNEKKGEKNV